MSRGSVFARDTLRFRTLLCLLLLTGGRLSGSPADGLPKIILDPQGRAFQTEDGRPFYPIGVTYFRPGTGWAPQVWTQFDPDATRADFARMKELGINCVRVFTSYGSFLNQPDAVRNEGLAKFDSFLDMAEAAGIYVHPTGPDHWEGAPTWTHQDRIADEQVLRALEVFWTELAARSRGRNVIFAYDLRNEPEVGWDTPVLREKWQRWVKRFYPSVEALQRAWSVTNASIEFDRIAIPPVLNQPGSRVLLDYQRFREDIADEWTERQVRAIKAVDPAALVTVGLIQWSVPALLPRISHYSGFRPERQAKLLDFLEVHFYPLERGFYEYASAEDEARNLAYLESVVREVALPGKPVVIGEFGWYGGGKLTIDQSRHPAASEEQQARWCLRVVETTRHLAAGWLNWGLYDHPEAQDVTQLTGLLTADGRMKSWGSQFKQRLTGLASQGVKRSAVLARPELNWDECLTSVLAGNQFRERYFEAYQNLSKDVPTFP